MTAARHESDDDYEEVIEYYDAEEETANGSPPAIKDLKHEAGELEGKLTSFLAATAEHRRRVEERERIR